jgi:hypothetical protein
MRYLVNYKNAKDVGYCKLDKSRFECLKYLDFYSVLDVGSGPCVLQSLLINKSYEAFDIREESLQFCDCVKHKTIPNKNYDLVCLFGTMTNINIKKTEYTKLLLDCSRIARKYIVYSLITIPQNSWLWYSEKEILDTIDLLKYKESKIITQKTEVIIVGKK